MTRPPAEPGAAERVGPGQHPGLPPREPGQPGAHHVGRVQQVPRVVDREPGRLQRRPPWGLCQRAPDLERGQTRAYGDGGGQSVAQPDQRVGRIVEA